jgi:hypothetical protein
MVIGYKRPTSTSRYFFIREKIGFTIFIHATKVYQVIWANEKPRWDLVLIGRSLMRWRSKGRVVTHNKWQAPIKTLAFEKWKVVCKRPQHNYSFVLIAYCNLFIDYHFYCIFLLFVSFIVVSKFFFAFHFVSWEDDSQCNLFVFFFSLWLTMFHFTSLSLIQIVYILEWPQN